jgi:hypothetical protein
MLLILSNCVAEISVIQGSIKIKGEINIINNRKNFIRVEE